MKVNLKNAPKSYLRYLRDLAYREIKHWHKMECIVGRGKESRKEINYWRDLLEQIHLNGLKVELK